MDNKIVRGTTPTLTFTLPFSAEQVAAAYVSFKQKDRLVLEKAAGAAGCACQDNQIAVTLTQEETLAFVGCCKVEMQVRVRSATGQALASKIVTAYVEDVIKNGVI